MAIPKFLNQMRHAVQDTGDTMTGNLNFTDGNTVNINGSQTTTKDYVDGNFVNRLGGTLNDGNLYSPNIYNATQISLLNDPQADMEAATKQYVDNSGGTFYAIYGTTTHAEILTAYNQGKTIVAVNNQYIGYLRTPPTEEESISFITMPLSTNYSSEYRYWWNVSTSNVWSSGRGYSGGYSFDAPIRLFNNTPINTSNYYRPINVSLNPPTTSDGQIGDIWIVYSNE